MQRMMKLRHKNGFQFGNLQLSFNSWVAGNFMCIFFDSVLFFKKWVTGNLKNTGKIQGETVCEGKL